MKPRLPVWSTLGTSVSLLLSKPGWIPLVYAPMALLSLLYARQVDAKALTPSQLLGETLLTTPLQILVTSAILYAVFFRLRGRNPSLGESLGVAFRCLLVVLGVNILTMLAFAVGFLLLVVPAVIVLTAFYLANAVAVLERRSVIASLRRSAQLTRGSRLRVLGVSLIPGVPLLGASLLRGLHPPTVAGTLLWTVVSFALGLFMSVTPAVVYARLLTLRGEPDPDPALAR